MELKKYKVLGYTTDFNSCDCCGKDNLKGTITIIDMDHDVILHFGTSCAAAAEKYDTLQSAQSAKKEIAKVVRGYKFREQWAINRAWFCLRRKYGKYASFETIGREILEPIVDQFISFYTNPNHDLNAWPEISKQFLVKNN